MIKCVSAVVLFGFLTVLGSAKADEAWTCDYTGVTPGAEGGMVNIRIEPQDPRIRLSPLAPLLGPELHADFTGNFPLGPMMTMYTKENETGISAYSPIENGSRLEVMTIVISKSKGAVAISLLRSDGNSWFYRGHCRQRVDHR